MTRIIIIEDNKITLDHLASLFSGMPGITVIGSYASGEDLLSNHPDIEPDIALTDLNLPGMSGIELIEHMRKLWPRLEVLCLTMKEDRKTLLAALKAGASGYIVKGASSLEIVQAVEEVKKGGVPLSPKIARYLIDEFKKGPRQSPDELLTAREKEILGGIAAGKTEKSLAEQFALSQHTIHAHIKNIYAKLKVKTKIDAITKGRITGQL